MVTGFGCANFQLQSGLKNVSKGNYLKAIKQFNKLENNENYRAIAYFQIAQLFANSLHQFDVALKFFNKAESEVQKNQYSVEKKFIIANLTKCIEKTIDCKFKDLEKDKVPIEFRMKKNSKTYHMWGEKYNNGKFDRTFPSNKIVCGIIIDKNDNYLRVKKSLSYGSLWLDIHEIKGINKNLSDVLRSLTKMTLSKRRKLGAYKVFLKKHSNPKYIELSQKRIDELSFEIATDSNSIKKFKEYLTEFPNGKYFNDAITQIDKISFDIAKKIDSINEYETYLTNNPRGNHIEKAKQRIEDLCFDKAFFKDSENLYTNYLRLYPKGRYLNETKMLLDELKSFKLALKNDSLISYSLFLDNYKQSRFYDKILTKLDKLEYKKAIKEGTCYALKLYILKYPDGIHVIDAKNQINRIIKSNINISSVDMNYSKSGVTIYGYVNNHNNFEVDAIIRIAFSTKTKKIKFGGSDFISNFQHKVYKGKSYTGKLKITVPPNTNKNFSKYFNTVVQGKYKGLVLDIFNTQANLRQRLKVHGWPNIKLYINEVSSENTKDKILLAKKYLEKAEMATSKEGVENILDFIKASSIVTKDTVKYKAQINYAEDAIRIAPNYAPAHLALARYSYYYANNTSYPTTKLQNFLKAIQEASIVLDYAPGNKEAFAIISKSQKKAANYVIPAGVGSIVSSNLQKIIISGMKNMQKENTLSALMNKTKYDTSYSYRNKKQIKQTTSSSKAPFVLEGNIFCQGYYYKNETVRVEINPFLGFISDGTTTTDRFGRFQYSTKNSYKSGNSMMSVKFVGACGEGYIRINSSKNNLKVKLH